MSFWANVFWANVFWANVSGQMSLGKCRMGKCRITVEGTPSLKSTNVRTGLVIYFGVIRPLHLIKSSNVRASLTMYFGVSRPSVKSTNVKTLKIRRLLVDKKDFFKLYQKHKDTFKRVFF
jgi:hypothetical protein